MSSRRSLNEKQCRAQRKGRHGLSRVRVPCRQSSLQRMVELMLLRTLTFVQNPSPNLFARFDYDLNSLGDLLFGRLVHHQRRLPAVLPVAKPDLQSKPSLGGEWDEETANENSYRPTRDVMGSRLISQYWLHHPDGRYKADD